MCGCLAVADAGALRNCNPAGEGMSGRVASVSSVLFFNTQSVFCQRKRYIFLAVVGELKSVDNFGNSRGRGSKNLWITCG